MAPKNVLSLAFWLFASVVSFPPTSRTLLRWTNTLSTDIHPPRSDPESPFSSQEQLYYTSYLNVDFFTNYM